MEKKSNIWLGFGINATRQGYIRKIKQKEDMRYRKLQIVPTSQKF